MKEHLNTLGVVLAAGLGILLTYWLTYYIDNSPRWNPPQEDAPTKEWPATPNHDKG